MSAPSPAPPPRGPRLLCLEPIGGAAGDMWIAALLRAGAPRRALDQAVEALRAAATPAEVDLRGVALRVTEVEVNGIRANHVEVEVPAQVAACEPHHRPYRVIRDLLARAALTQGARALSLSAFRALAEAEGRVHGVPPDEVEFHEVGAVDALVDVVGTAALLDALAPSRTLCLPPPAGGGVGRSAHGAIPLPAPAVLELMRGRPLRASGPGERLTPTGAALIAAWTQPVDTFPDLAIEAIGCGAGTKRWDDAPNLLRAVLGAPPAGAAAQAAWLLEANLDDQSPQLLAVALEAALQAGAADAWLTPATMKKGRAGQVLSALVDDSRRAAVEAVFFRETSTLGVRAQRIERRALDRRLVEVQTRYGPIRVKLGLLPSGEVLNAAPEFEDCASAAREHGVPVKEVHAEALAAYRARPPA